MDTEKIAREILAEVRGEDDIVAVVIIRLALMRAELDGYKTAVNEAKD